MSNFSETDDSKSIISSTSSGNKSKKKSLQAVLVSSICSFLNAEVDHSSNIPAEIPEHGIVNILASSIYGFIPTVCWDFENSNNGDCILKKTSDDAIRLETTSFPFGKAALIHLPNTRSGSHPVQFTKWLDYVEKLQFNDIVNVLPDTDTDLHTYMSSELICGITQENSGESRQREYKLPVGCVDRSLLQGYLRNSFLPCMHAGDAELWIGICDTNNCFIGVEDKYDLKILAESSWEYFSSSLFPPISNKFVQIGVYSLIGSTLSDWGDQCYSYHLNCDSAAQIANLYDIALRVFCGYCQLIDTTLYVEMNIYQFVRSTLPNMSKVYAVDSSWTPIHRCAYDYVYKNLYCKKDDAVFKAEPTFDWIIDSNDWILREASDISKDSITKRRQILSIKVTGVPTNVTKCVTTNMFSNDEGWSKFLDHKNHLVEMTAYHIWLRMKGVDHGGSKSGLVLPFIYEDLCRILVVPNEEQSLCIASVHSYFNSAMVNFDSIVNVLNDAAIKGILGTITADCRRSVFLITTSSAISSANKLAKALNAANIELRTIVFTPLRAEARFDKILQCGELNVVDICILAEDRNLKCTSVTMDTQLHESSNTNLLLSTEDNAFELLPYATLDGLDGDDQNSQAIRNYEYQCKKDAVDWVLGSKFVNSPISWNVVSKYVVKTKISHSILSQVEKSDGVTSLQLIKRFPGSGASSLLCGVGWELREKAVVCRLVPLKDLQVEKAIAKFEFEYSKRRNDWLVLLIDDDIGSEQQIHLASLFDSLQRMVERGAHFKKVTILHVVNTKVKNKLNVCHSFEVNPILKREDLKQVLQQLKHLFPDATGALEELSDYALSEADKVNRHIYVLMQTATRGRFNPPRKFFSIAMQQLQPPEANVIVLLAFLSVYSTSYRSVSREYFSVQFSATARDLLRGVDNGTGNYYAFMHPYLAGIFLTIVSSPIRGITHQLESYMARAERVEGSRNIFQIFLTSLLGGTGVLINYSTAQQILSNVLFCRLQGYKFSKFVSHVLKVFEDPQGAAHFIDSNCRKVLTETGFLSILISKMYRSVS